MDTKSRAPGTIQMQNVRYNWNSFVNNLFLPVKDRIYDSYGKLEYISSFRSVGWIVLLRYGNASNLNSIKEDISRQRTDYSILKQGIFVDHTSLRETHEADDPLSQEDSSQWNQYFVDQELKQIIRQDVLRTHPDIPFFHNSQISSILSDILFVYCKSGKFPYRQGMHELLAPMILVCKQDRNDFADFEHGSDLSVLLDPDHLESDSFLLFSTLMKWMEPWYQADEPKRQLTKADISQNSERPLFATTAESTGGDGANSEIERRLSVIGQLLEREQPDLASYLRSMEIFPQVYGIRWLRLLFGREFALEDVLIIWDLIFSYGFESDIVDFIYLSMLLYLRDLIRSSSYSDCLTALMKFPPVSGVNHMIQMACHLHGKYRPDLHLTPSIHRPVNFTYRPETTAADFKGFASGRTPPKSGRSGHSDGSSVRSRRPAELKALTDFCSSQMDLHLSHLQRVLIQQPEFATQANSVDFNTALMALAGLKHVRDLLRGSLRLTPEMIHDTSSFISAENYARIANESGESGETNGSGAASDGSSRGASLADNPRGRNGLGGELAKLRISP